MVSLEAHSGNEHGSLSNFVLSCADGLELFLSKKNLCHSFWLFCAEPASEQSLDIEMAEDEDLEDFDLFSETYDEAKEAEEARRLAAHRATLPKGYVGEIASLFLELGLSLMFVSKGCTAFLEIKFQTDRTTAGFANKKGEVLQHASSTLLALQSTI